MSYSPKNYTEQGGDVTHIGGKLIFEDGAQIEGFSAAGGGSGSYTLPTASAKTLGGVKAKAKTTETVEVAVDGSGKLYVPAVPQIAAQTECSSEDTVGIKEAFNELLTKLKASGLMASE